MPPRSEAKSVCAHEGKTAVGVRMRVEDAMRRRDPQLVQALVVSHVEGMERYPRRSLG